MAEEQATMTRLTRRIVTERISDLIELSKQLKGDYWTLEHYLSDLNNKWELSRVILDNDGRVLAFIIVSEKPESLHVHRIVVSKELQGRGIGRKLIAMTSRDANWRGKEAITLKAEADNNKTITFYKDLGFEITGEQGTELVLMKLSIT